MSDVYEPPPMDYDNLEPPPEIYLDDPWTDRYSHDGYDAGLDFDPYPPPPDYDLIPIPDDYTLDDLDTLPDFPPPSQDGLQGFEALEPDDESWSWHDARLIGVDRGAEAEDARYEVGAIDLYASATTGDIGGSYLPIATFGDEAPASAFYHNLQQELHEQGLAPWQVSDFAQNKTFEMNPEPQNWRGVEPAEYTAYEYTRDLEVLDSDKADDPPIEAIDPLLQKAIELGGVVVEQAIETVPDVDDSAFQALRAIGIQADNFDPRADPPPFYDAETGTAYWIGVFQPDKADRENCVTSILSLGRDPDTGEMEAQLAPCVPGDWDKAYGAAEYLLQVADRGGIEQLFDTAEGMALATDQRETWETPRGLPLEADTTREIADYTRDNWEVGL